MQRGIEIISEASRHLSSELKARHPKIPWQNVAGIGNVLRHGYEDIAAPVLWKLVRDDLPVLEAVCRAELDGEINLDQTPTCSSQTPGAGRYATVATSMSDRKKRTFRPEMATAAIDLNPDGHDPTRHARKPGHPRRWSAGSPNLDKVGFYGLSSKP